MPELCREPQGFCILFKQFNTFSKRKNHFYIIGSQCCINGNFLRFFLPLFSVVQWGFDSNNLTFRYFFNTL